MKFVTFTIGAQSSRPGVLVDDGSAVVDLQACYDASYKTTSPILQSLQTLIEANDEGLGLACDLVSRPRAVGCTHVYPLSAVKLLAPLPRPTQMRDFLCFEKHLLQGFQMARKLRASLAPDPEHEMREMDRLGILSVPQVWYERPLCYHPNRLNVVGPDTDVQWPAYSDRIDYELEFACVIGRHGKDIPLDKARDHIFGYTIFNDLSARDEQLIDMASQLGPGKGKNFDGSNVLGPCIVTKDEIGDPYTLGMRVRVNGELRGEGNSGEMHWSFEQCISHVSRSETLYPGEIIASGTVGNGCGIEIGKFMQRGDVVELEVDRIGVLRNRIV